MGRPKQKSAVLNEDFVHKCSKRGPVLLDAFSMTLFKAKAGLFQDKCRQFFGGENDNNSWQKYISSFVQVQAPQVLYDSSEMTVGGQLRESSSVHLAIVESTRLRESLDS